MKTAKEMKADYEAFIDRIPDYLEKVEEFLEIEELSYSPEEMDRVQALYFDNRKAPAALGMDKEEFGLVFCAYAGEAFIHHRRGNWDLSKLKTDEAFGTPIILNWGNAGKPRARISPWVWKTQIDKGQLRKGIKSEIIPYSPAAQE